MTQLINSFLIASTVTVLVAQPVPAEVTQVTTIDATNSLSPTPLVKRNTKGGRISRFVAQRANDITQITAIRLNPTDRGLEVVFETPDSKTPQVFTSSYRNTFVVNILNTQLALLEGKSFRQENPVAGIVAVNVTQQGANSIRVTVVGTTVPKVEVVRSDASGRLRQRALVLSVTPAADTTVQTTPALTPDSEQTEELVEPTDEATQEPDEQLQEPAETVEEDQPIEIVVTGDREDGYSVPNATTGTRTDTPLRDIPQSIQVVPQQVLEDQQVIRLNDALRNVSGVRDDDVFAGTIDRINIRGFTQDVFLRDNFRQSQFSLRETANLERIEVLKGPASVLYGNLEPGGVVNLVTKKPLSEPYYSAELLVGSYGFYQPNIDLSGPLNTDRTLVYRLNGVYESNDGFRDFDEVIAGSALERRSTDDQNVERVFVAPVLTWDISDKTALTLEFDYLNDERPFDDGLVAIGTGVAEVPSDRVFQNPDAVRTVEEFGAGYQLEHRFSENWTLRNAFRFLSSEDFDFRLTSWIIDDTGQLDRRWRSNDDLSESYALQTNLVGQFTTGAINHTLLFGVDLNRETTVGGQRRLPDAYRRSHLLPQKQLESGSQFPKSFRC